MKKTRIDEEYFMWFLRSLEETILTESDMEKIKSIVKKRLDYLVGKLPKPPKSYEVEGGCWVYCNDGSGNFNIVDEDTAHSGGEYVTSYTGKLRKRYLKVILAVEKLQKIQKGDV